MSQELGVNLKFKAKVKSIHDWDCKKECLKDFN